MAVRILPFPSFPGQLLHQGLTLSYRQGLTAMIEKYLHLILEKGMVYALVPFVKRRAIFKKWTAVLGFYFYPTYESSAEPTSDFRKRELEKDQKIIIL